MPIPENIYRAAGNGNLELVRTYFAAGDRDPNDLHEETGCTLLGPHVHQDRGRV